MTDNEVFDVDRFYAALDTERQHRRQNWKEVSEDAQVSQSTLSRLKSGTRPDIESFVRLCRWASVDANQFVQSPDSLALEQSAPSAIGALLRADPSLDSTSAAAIEAILNAAYEKLRGLQR
jgi:transcriptional regulator with XRE-family HTH domain